MRKVSGALELSSPSVFCESKEKELYSLFSNNEAAVEWP